MRRIALAVFAAALTFLALSAPTAAGGCMNDARPTEGASPAVRIDKCQFMSAILRVPVGTTGTWTNAEEWLPHEINGIGWGWTPSMVIARGTYSPVFAQDRDFP